MGAWKGIWEAKQDYDARKDLKSSQEGKLWGRHFNWGRLWDSLPLVGDEDGPDYEDVPMITGKDESGKPIIKSGASVQSQVGKNTRKLIEKYEEEYDEEVDEATRKEKLEEGLLSLIDNFRNIGQDNEEYMYESPF